MGYLGLVLRGQAGLEIQMWVSPNRVLRGSGLAPRHSGTLGRGGGIKTCQENQKIEINRRKSLRKEEVVS